MKYEMIRRRRINNVRQLHEAAMQIDQHMVLRLSADFDRMGPEEQKLICSIQGAVREYYKRGRAFIDLKTGIRQPDGDQLRSPWGNNASSDQVHSPNQRDRKIRPNGGRKNKGNRKHTN